MGQTIILSISLVISFLLLLRTYEMINHCFLALKVSRSGVLNIKNVTTSWPITKYFIRYKFLNFIYRLPVLIPVSSGFLAFIKEPQWAILTSAAVILLSLLVQMGQTVLSRILFGKDDKYMRHWFTVINWDDRDKNLPAVSDEAARRDMAVFLIGFVFLSIVGYAAIYLATSHWKPYSFDVPIGDYLDSVYFSAVTFATVGFGDIKPVSTIARLLVVSEIAVSFGTLVVLVLSYSLTYTPEKSEKD